MKINQKSVTTRCADGSRPPPCGFAKKQIGSFYDLDEISDSRQLTGASTFQQTNSSLLLAPQTLRGTNYPSRKLTSDTWSPSWKGRLATDLHLVTPGQPESVEKSRKQRRQRRQKTTMWLAHFCSASFARTACVAAFLMP